MGHLAPVESQPLARIEDAKEYMLTSFRQFRSLVGGKPQADRFLAIGIHCLESNPKLLDCPRASFRNSLVEAARLDLEPNSVQQLSWIIPRALKAGQRPIARLEVGYRGLVQLVFRDGGVRDIWAMAIDEADEFRRQEGTTRGLVHEKANPLRDGKVETMVGAYAVAILHSGERAYKVMDREELDDARAMSKSSAYEGKWAMQMYLKTPIKRLCKTLPLKSPDVAKTISLEDDRENIVPDPEPQPEVEVIEVRSEEKSDAASPREMAEKATEILGGEVVCSSEDMELKPQELPRESREELIRRITENWNWLEGEDIHPKTAHPREFYTSDECDEATMKRAADTLTRMVLEAERRLK